jgi:hypothetical protein
MILRPFDWRDIPTIHRYRHQSVFMDSFLLLTRGALLLPGALLSYLAPATGIFTCVASGNETRKRVLIGQFIHMLGSQYAHLTFLAPEDGLNSSQVSSLLDYMVSVSGERGALRLLADVNELSQAYETLRHNGFATFTRQRIWRFDGGNSLLEENNAMTNAWRLARSRDGIAIRLLYNNLVPGLVQQAEPAVVDRIRGRVCYQGDRLQAYVEIKYGHRGIWVQPFVHPDTQDIPSLLVGLINNIPNRLSRPLYICVRSYQAWLESAIETLGAQAGPRQAVMVRHMAAQKKVGRKYALPALEGGQAEVSASIARSENNNLYDTTHN